MDKFVQDKVKLQVLHVKSDLNLLKLVILKNNFKENNKINDYKPPRLFKFNISSCSCSFFFNFLSLKEF